MVAEAGRDQWELLEEELGLAHDVSQNEWNIWSRGAVAAGIEPLSTGDVDNSTIYSHQLQLTNRGQYGTVSRVDPSPIAHNRFLCTLYVVYSFGRIVP